MCSVKNDFPFDLDGLRYFYDFDKTGMLYSMKRLEQNRSVFLWRKYLQDNEITNEKIKDLTDLQVFMKRNPHKKFKRFADYFSTSKLDIIWI